ncbi:hypothetical protein [Actinokineospora sp. NBRC 105648]|uniref:ATP-grasp domain-containing protein n=1 Tax=Actinokineospora sp. NBRC 105648 TaxID=3032206 RepID=UPI002556B61B|nr:hypothetical protein [Actinokineospora sp. NBRC 105648]
MSPATALVTDVASLPIDFDMPLLLEACREAGVRTEVCQWDDPSVEWSGFAAVLLRSPWSYVDRLPEFLSWCDRVAAETRLFNPVSVAHWSLDKTYLADLAARGVAVVPTTFLGPDDDPREVLAQFLAEHPGAGEIVVKPTVGAYSKDVQRFARLSADEAAHYAARLRDKGSGVMLQPYLAAVDRDGETDMIFFDGVYSHAIRKSPLLLPDGTVNVPTQDARSPRAADAAERALGTAALDAVAAHLGLDAPLLYGRVDLVRDDDGAPVVLEVELCEPSLSLPFTDLGATRFAHALARRLD